MHQIYQQGDVILQKEKTLPKGAKKVPARDGRFILAEGEATGHHHSVPATKGVALLEAEDSRWLTVKQPVELTHQEHDVQIILPGVYKLGQVREVDPFSEEIHAVRD